MAVDTSTSQNSVCMYSDFPSTQVETNNQNGLFPKSHENKHFQRLRPELDETACHSSAWEQVTNYLWPGHEKNITLINTCFQRNEAYNG
jgi:hypothetical protein